MFKKFVNLLTFWVIHTVSQCLKITKNVSFYIASEASYVCNILKCPEMVNLVSFEKMKHAVKQCYQTGQL